MGKILALMWCWYHPQSNTCGPSAILHFINISHNIESLVMWYHSFNFICQLAIRSVERGICQIAGVKYDVAIMLLDKNML